jgi:hypothetical protein
MMPATSHRFGGARRWLEAGGVGCILGIAITVGAFPASAQRIDTTVKVVSMPLKRGVATLVPELTIGVADGAPEYMFSSVGEIFVARDGSVLVLDYPSAAGVSVRQYSRDGKFLRHIGRRGQGPGEFQSPAGMAQLPDGRLVVRDVNGRRINVYSETGEPVGTWSLAAYNYSVRGPDGVRVDPRGLVHVPIVMPPEGSAPSHTRRLGLLRLRLDGTIIDTLVQPELPDVSLPIVTATKTDSSGVTSRLTAVAYSPGRFLNWSPRGYFISGFTNRYALDMRIPPAPPGASRDPLGGTHRRWQPGDPVISIRRDVAPVPVSAAERREQRAYAEAMAMLLPGATLSGSLPDVPLVKPFLKSVSVDADGRLWILLSTPSERFDPPARATPPGQQPRPQILWREPVVYDVIEPEGTYIGQVGVPFGTTISWTSGNIAWGVVRDPDGVPVVKRFRLVWP